MSKPWEQREDESSKAYAAFMTYLELGPDRSIDKAATASAPQKSRKSRAWHWQSWSRRFDWVARAGAYDAHLFSERIAARDKVREQARQAAVDAAQEAVLTIADAMRFDHADNPVGAVKARIDAAAKILALAGVDAPKRVELSGPDGKTMEIDVRSMLADAVDKLNIDPDTALELAEKIGRKED